MTTARNSRVLWTILLLISVCLVSMPAQAQFGGGRGEPDDPFLIHTAQQMNNIGANPDDWDKHFKLMADIDLSGYTGTEFNIIGYFSLDGDIKPFTGVFDGNDHTISNFSYTSEEADFIGLFGYCGIDVEINNLELIDPNVDAGTGIVVGSLVGLMEFGTITNCNVQNGNVSGFGFVGGLAGHTVVDIISDCNVSATVSGFDRVGGLVGENRAGIIESCSSVSTVTGITVVGGLVGANDFMLVLDLFFPGVIAECYAEGTVLGMFSVGGLVGDNFTMVLDSFAAAEADGFDRVGGLVGYNFLWEDAIMPPRVAYCYSVGSVTGGSNAGGLVGINEGGMVTNSFWDTQSSGRSGSSGGTGRTTSRMQAKSNFTSAGWDFVDETSNGTDDIWWINEGQDYPRFSWELMEDDPNDEPNDDEPNTVAGPLSEAMDTDLIFETGGDADWFSTTIDAYFDGDAAQSGNITHNQESWLRTTVSGAGTVSFYWKASSEENYDLLEFYVDDTLQDQISGETDWQQMTHDISGSASHTLEWRYFKEGSMSSGDDCGWVDKVEW